MDRSQIMILTLPGFPCTSLAIAGCRAGGKGVLDLEYVPSVISAQQLIAGLVRLTDRPFGLRVEAKRAAFVNELLSSASSRPEFVVLASPDNLDLQVIVDCCKQRGTGVLLECTGLKHAEAAKKAGADGIIVKGNEAGGRGGRESTFILLQQVIKNVPLPVWVQGGIGLHTAAACMAAGAAGIVLDSQLAFARESPLSENEKRQLAALDGTETLCLGEEEQETCFRLLSRPNVHPVRSLQEYFRKLLLERNEPDRLWDDFHSFFAKYVGGIGEENRLYPFGQDIALARELARKYATVSGIMEALCANATESLKIAADQFLPTAANPLAKFHGTTYPFVQGPMARVSDRPAFAKAVSDHGALPFVAAAMMSGERLGRLLKDTAAVFKEKSWGVGLLGFLPADHFKEQVRAVLDNKPGYALIAGGRPEQVKLLEESGIVTYVHVPTPTLLRMYLNSGLRRFVFEGREAGGHIAPLCSFVLWEIMTDILLQHAETAVDTQDLSVLYAGGIHDGLSAAMISCLAAPLAAKGVKIGFQLGSAYLFTDEAVSSGAIVERYRQEAIRCDHTVILETGLGHASRCLETPFVKAFCAQKQKMMSEGLAPRDIRDRLEKMNLGRLQAASRGTMKDPGKPESVRVLDDAEQFAEGLYMVGQLAALHNRATSIAELHTDIAEGGRKILETFRRPEGAAPPSRKSATDIAVIGMSCILPGAPDIERYWENILNKVNAIREVPPERWDWKQYYDADRNAKDKCYSRWGGFLEDYPFNPLKYGIPPNSIASIEPLQLLSLEVASQVIEDAGYANRPFCRERTSVIFGISGVAELGQLYSVRSTLPELFGDSAQAVVEKCGASLPEWTEDSFPGILVNVTAGRIANRFDLGGTNFTVDAACASSLAAVYLGVKELENGASDMVIVGAADCMQNPFTFLCFAKTNALSPRGRCRTFDEEADGIAISEGVAALMLKRLDDAERDGDRIYCVLKAVGTSSDGRGKSLTAPRQEGQIRTFQRAYEQAGVSPDSVGLIEAHGTGTVVGDRVEVEALNTFFSEFAARPQGCAIGSVKSLIGHTKSTAGIAGIIKTALALYHKVLPPTAGITRPNPALREQASPFYANIESRPWVQDMLQHPRRAGVSALGFGGTNFHAVIEEYDRALTAHPPRASFQNWPAELFLFQGESRQEIFAQLNDLKKLLPTTATIKLADLSYTLSVRHSGRRGAEAGQQRTLAIIATDGADLLAKLDMAQSALAQEGKDIHDPRGLYFCENPLAGSGKVVFLFPGQGSQYENMFSDLAVQFPEVCSRLERSDHILAGRFDKPLSSFIYPPPAFSEEAGKENVKSLAQTRIAQPSLGTVSLAMFHLLGKFGIRPHLAAGHSYGEYVALSAAGVIREDDLIDLSEARGRYIVQSANPEPGTMAAVNSDADTVEKFLSGLQDVWIANLNAPDQTIISGTEQAVVSAVERFSAVNIKARRIPVACAFHSPIVAGAGKMLQQHLERLEIGRPSFPVYSNTTAMPHSQEPSEVRAQLAAHLAQGVQFVKEVQNIHGVGGRIFIEIGPGRALTGMVSSILAGQEFMAVTSNQAGRSGLLELQHLLGQLAAHGLPIQTETLFERRNPSLLDLSALGQTGGMKDFPPGTWLLSGAKARQAFAPSRKAPAGVGEATMHLFPAAEKKQRLFVAETPSESGQPRVGAPPVTDDVAWGKLVDEKSMPQTPFIPSGDYDQVMVQHQRLMQRFLEVQHRVMASYLQGNSPVEAGIAPFPDSVQGIVAPFLETHQQGLQVPEPSGTVEEPESVASGQVGYASLLKRMVSERTGYPLEMLEENQDLEADLGIDSIKRVEILAGFLQKAFAGEPGPVPVTADSLGKLRTLRQIVEHVENTCQAGKSAGENGAALPVLTSAGQQLAVPKGAPAFCREDLLSLLQGIVSERTGYPLEMLEEKQDLEADLGIDSIKRVEILAGFLQKAFAGELIKVPVTADNLGKLRTLQQIVECVMEKTRATDDHKILPAAHVSAVKKVDAAGHFAENDMLPPRYTLAAVPAPLKNSVSFFVPVQGVLLLTADDYGLAEILAEKLEKAGCRTALLYCRTHEIGPGRHNAYKLQSWSQEEISSVLPAIQEQFGRVGGLIHLSPLTKGMSFWAVSLDDWKQSLETEVSCLFYMLKFLEKDIRDTKGTGGKIILSATSMGGEFAVSSGGNDSVFRPSQGGVVGLLKTVKEEWPEAQVKAVDLNLTEPLSQLADHLFTEIHHWDGLPEVGYNNAKRFRLELVKAPLLQRLETNDGPGPSSVVLITGGGRGITAEAALELARNYKPQLILVGRSPQPAAEENETTRGLFTMQELKSALIEEERKKRGSVSLPEVEEKYRQLLKEREIREKLAAIRNAGSPVEYIQVDVRDPEAFGRVIDDIYQRYGVVDGVIHGAGIIEDKLIADMTPESFRRVLGTKAESVFILSRKIKPAGLKFFVLFSSVAGRFGNPGQSAYTAANEVMNKVAVCLNTHWPGKVVSINWGPWMSGMVSEELERQFVRRGVRLIPLKEGAQMLGMEILRGRKEEVEVVVGDGPWGKIEGTVE